jgi:hypothetical protein
MVEPHTKLESAGLKASLKARPAGKTTPNLSAVVCPLTPREMPVALANLDRWGALLGRRPPTRAAPPRLIFSFNCGPQPAYERALGNRFRQSPHLMSAFAGLEVRFCNLPPEKDAYAKDSPTPASRYGNKAGPNWLFYETVKSLRRDCDFIFLMETDCEPIAPDWLQRLEETCALNKDAWIIGSHYRGVSPLTWRIARHLNGNALYKVGDAGFWEFLDGLLWPWMLDHIATVNPDLAYDCAWETFLNRPEMEDAAHYDWIVSRALLDRFRLCGTIVNIAGEAEQRGDYAWTKETIVQRFPDAVVVHGPLAPPTNNPRGIVLGPWRFNGKPSPAQRGPAILRPAGWLERSVWLPARPLEAGDSMEISVGFSTPPPNGLKIEIRNSIGRLLDRLKVPSQTGMGPTAAMLRHVFTSPHPFVRIWFLHLNTVRNQPPLKLLEGTVKISREGRRIAAAKDIF